MVATLRYRRIPYSITWADPAGTLDAMVGCDADLFERIRPVIDCWAGSVTRIGDMIEKLQAELHLTSVIVTGDMKIAFRVADRMALIHEGHIAHLGTPDYFRECDASEVKEFVRDPDGREVRY